jgi:polysaccharide export outer membrane protein
MRRSFVLFAIAGLISGCTEYPITLVPAVADPHAAPELYRPQVDQEYRVEPGDSLLVQSYFDQTLRQTVVVGPDGRISLLLVGDVSVAGKTVREISELVRKRYAGRLPDKPDINVAINELSGLSVYVGGEVRTPSVVPIKGSLTLMQAIAEAGGFLASANQHQVIILRRGPDGTFTARQQNASLVLRNEAGEMYMRRRDIIFVPKTEIAQLDQFVDQYINQIIPRPVQTLFGYQILQQTVGASSPAITVP